MTDTQHTTSNNTAVDIKDTALKFGFLGGVTGILISLILFFGNLQYESWSKWLQTLVMLVAIILGIKTIADTNKNKLVSFGALFKGGMLITAVVTTISILYFILYSNFIETDFINNILELTRKQLEEKGLTEDQIEKTLEMSKTFMHPGIMAAISLFSSMSMGAILSLIGAAIFKREKI